MRCSIVLSTFNKHESLALALSSIFSQDISFDFEVIVVNDGPYFETAQVCKKFGDKLKYIETGNQSYRNPAAARNVGYKAATGDVIISQCDDILHITKNSVERLVRELGPNEFLLAKTENWSYIGGSPNRYRADYCSARRRPVPYFFLGSVYREHIYAIGGNDEEFVEPCYDDNWFADCLTKGLGLRPRHDDTIIAHHMEHPYPAGSHKNESASKAIYERKVRDAANTGIYQASGGPWPFASETAVDPCLQFEYVGSIPKCMNFFWTTSPLSWLRYLTIRSFRQMNPDWQIKLFICDVAGEQYAGNDWGERLGDLGIEIVEWEPPFAGLSAAHASDFFQWELLSTTGGFYADMDILFVRPLDYEMLQAQDSIFCNSQGYVTIGFLGASRGNPMFSELYNEALRGYNSAKYQNTGAEAAYRLAKMGTNWGKIKNPSQRVMDYFRGKYPQLRLLQLPDEYVYPFVWNRPQMLWSQTRGIPDACVGIHWFGGSPKSQEMMRKFDPTEGKLPECTMANFAKFYA